MLKILGNNIYLKFKIKQDIVLEKKLLKESF